MSTVISLAFRCDGLKKKEYCMYERKKVIDLKVQGRCGLMLYAPILVYMDGQVGR